MAPTTPDPSGGNRDEFDDATDGGGHRPTSASGLFHSLSSLVGNLLATVHTRLELLTNELQEEIRDVGAILLWAFVTAFAALLALFLAALAVIFIFWDTHRVAATLVMIGLFVAVAASAALVLVRKLRGKEPLLNNTLAELAKDRDQLKARL